MELLRRVGGVWCGVPVVGQPLRGTASISDAELAEGVRARQRFRLRVRKVDLGDRIRWGGREWKVTGLEAETWGARRVYVETEVVAAVVAVRRGIAYVGGAVARVAGQLAIAEVPA